MGAQPGDVPGLQILVVEDDDSARTIHAELFHYHGANVRIAGSARSALMQHGRRLQVRRGSEA